MTHRLQGQREDISLKAQQNRFSEESKAEEIFGIPRWTEKLLFNCPYMVFQLFMERFTAYLTLETARIWLCVCFLYIS